MTIWYSEISSDICKARHKGTLVEQIGIEFTEIGDDYLIARMPVDSRTKQPVGILHGGASCALIETVGSVGGNFCVDHAQFYCVGLEINVNHIRPTREGFIYGKGKPFHLGKTTQVWGVELTNDAQKLVAVGRITLAVLKR